MDFDSYRVQLDKKADITLGGNGELTPSNADGTGGKPEPELDLLSNIIQGFNDKFGDIDWGEDDKVKRALNNISDDVISDTEFIKSTQNADKQNMRITFDKVLEDVKNESGIQGVPQDVLNAHLDRNAGVIHHMVFGGDHCPQVILLRTSRGFE